MGPAPPCPPVGARPVTSRPKLDGPPLELPSLVGALELIWLTLFDLADRLADVPWAVVGGQMVFLHGAEHGVAAEGVV
jgi:hypothetical protein